MIRPGTCPICKKSLPLVAEGEKNWFPFCSERCRKIDLSRWFDGKYAIVEPLNPDDLDEELSADESSPA